MFEIYSFCRAVDDIADDGGPREPRRGQSTQWRADIDALYRGAPSPRARRACAAVAHIRSAARGFPRRHRRHGDGRDRRHPRARPADARSLLRPRRERRRAAVGARLRHGARRRARARASSRPRAATDQHPARHRRGRRHRPPLSAARGAASGRHRRDATRRRSSPIRRSAQACAPSCDARESDFARPTRSWRKARAAWCARRESWARPIGSISSSWRARLRGAARAVKPLPRASFCSSCCAISCDLMSANGPHHRRRPRRPLGGGRARRSGANCRGARGDRAAGGRCRSYLDSALGMTIDNGNHLLLSGNHAALGYLRSIGAEHQLAARRSASSPSSIWRAASAGRCASTTADSVVDFRSRPARAGHARARLSRAGAAAAGRRRASRSAKSSPARARSTSGWSSRFFSPRSISIRPRARRRSPAPIVRETLAGAARACRPLVAREGLAPTLIEPALAFLQERGAERALRSTVARACGFAADRVDGARFRRATRSRSRPTTRSCSRCRLTSPRRSLPDLDRADRVPRHRQRAFPHRAAAGAAADPRRAQRARREWLFAFPGRLSVTISAADASSTRRAKNWRRRSGPRSRASPDFQPRCRPGRSCANAAPPSPRRPRRTPSGPAPRRRWRNLRSRRRLDRDRPARDHRRRDPIRQSCRRHHRASNTRSKTCSNVTVEHATPLAANRRRALDR